MRDEHRPLVYTTGLDRLTGRAIAADLPGARIRSLRPLRAQEERRSGPRPALVVLDLTSTDAAAERTAVWHTWGPEVAILGLDRDRPTARLWQTPTRTGFLEVAPGYLAPVLSQAAGDGAATETNRGRLPIAVRLAAYAGSAWALTTIDPHLGELLLWELAILLPVLLAVRRQRLRADLHPSREG